MRLRGRSNSVGLVVATVLVAFVANLDLRVYRDIRVLERMKLQVWGGVFNTPNHADFLLPVAGISKAAFNLITGAVAQSGFGAQRQVQLAAKLTF